MKATKTKLTLAPAKPEKATVTRKDYRDAQKWVARQRVGIIDRLSIEQQVQVGRLGRAGGFEGTTPRERDEETIYTLAAAALHIFGLDQVAEDAVCRISEVVFGNDNKGGSELSTCGKILEAAGNDAREAGVEWTRKQRAVEREMEERALAKAAGA
jgi:hypothetical protein